MEYFGAAILLDHIPVSYYRCLGCGFVRTEDPSWLSEAYATPIARLDVGLLSRCFRLANVTEAVVRTMPAGGRYLDWGGGYGVLTRLLRDRGLDFRHHDAYAPNYFAIGLEGEIEETWDLVTMFEVLEHLTDPFHELERLAAAAPVLLFSTQLLPEPAPLPGLWWYYALETGQHVSLYTLQTLQTLAARLGRRLVSDGVHLHALCSGTRLPRAAQLIIRSPPAADLLRLMLRRLRPTPSLIDHDFQAARRALPGVRLDPP